MGRPLYSEQTQISAVEARTKGMTELNIDEIITSAGGSTLFYIYAPAGYLIETTNLQFYIESPPGATTGNHEVYGYNVTDGNILPMILAKFDFNKNAVASYGALSDDALAESKPTNRLEFMKIIESLKADSNNPIRFLYKNNTDVDLDPTAITYKYIRLMYTKLKISES